MTYTIHAATPDGITAFDATLNFLPHIGEEIEANSFVFVVDKLRYVLKDGVSYGNIVRLTVRRIQ